MTDRPGRIAAAIPIDLPRPRDLHLLQEERFAGIAGKIRQAIVVA
jgi:ABC-type nitrate/sulfonate/bicarbonate transport system ATPase subunit